MFSNVNISVAAGESVALIGASGIGKTTLLKVMSGLLMPERGDIFIGGFDINKIGINNFRSNIACVLQEDRLFSGSIADNISGFDEEMDRALLVDCAMRGAISMKRSSACRWAMKRLSASFRDLRRSKAALAHCPGAYQKPKILFMDEATSPRY